MSKEIIMCCLSCERNQKTGKFCQDCGGALTKRTPPLLEEAFAKLVKEITPKIKAELDQANDHLCNAMHIANQEGVPFYDRADDTVFIPESFYLKHNVSGKIVEKLIPQIFEYDIEGKFEGWISSSDRC